MIIDGRTKLGKEQKVINQIMAHGGFPYYWVTSDRARACAVDRLIENGTIRKPDGAVDMFPWNNWEVVI
jgi:hypothetical protein